MKLDCGDEERNVMNEQIEKMLRESLAVETPETADARILTAIRIEAAARRRWRRMRWRAPL